MTVAISVVSRDSDELDGMTGDTSVLLVSVGMTGDTSVLFGAKLDEAPGNTTLALGMSVESGTELTAEPGYD